MNRFLVLVASVSYVFASHAVVLAAPTSSEKAVSTKKVSTKKTEIPNLKRAPAFGTSESTSATTGAAASTSGAASSAGQIRARSNTATFSSIKEFVARSQVSAGMLVSDYTGTEGAHFQSSSGLIASVLADFGRSPVVVESGPQYRQMGAVSRDRTIGFTSSVDYLAVPVAAKIYFGDHAKTSVFAKMGLVPSFAVNKTASVRGLSTLEYFPVNTLDIGGVVAIGGKVHVGGSAFFVAEASYNRGFTKVFNDKNRAALPGILATNDLNLFNTGFAVTGGLAFEM